MTETLHIYKERGKWHAGSLRLLFDSLHDGNYAVTVSDSVAKRSNPQNDRIHTLCRLLAKELNTMQATGPTIHHWTMEDVKELALSMFAPSVQVVDPNGVPHERRKRSHEMSSPEASTFMEAVEAYFITEFGILIPEPNEQQQIPI